MTNDLHYVHREQHDAHDVLLCVGTGNNLDTPNRMKFETQDFYLKIGGPDGGAVPGPAGGHPQHAPHRRHVRRGPPAGRAADPALPGARRRDRRDLAAQGVRGRPRAALRRDHPGAPAAARLRAGRDHLDGLRRVLPDRGRLRPVRPGAGDRDHLPRQRPGLDRDLHAGHHAGRPHRLRAAVRAVPQPRPRDDARHRRRLRGRAPGRGHRLRQPQVRPGPRRPDHHVRHDARARGDPRRRPRHGHGLRRGRPDRQGRSQPAGHQARRGARDSPAAQGACIDDDTAGRDAASTSPASSRASRATPPRTPRASSSAASR